MLRSNLKQSTSFGSNFRQDANINSKRLNRTKSVKNMRDSIRISCQGKDNVPKVNIFNNKNVLKGASFKTKS